MTGDSGWLPIPGYEQQYCINKKGDIKRIGTGRGVRGNRLLAQVVAKNGYKIVTLWKNNKSKTHYVHRLLAENFIEGDRCLSVNHKDGNKLNNRLENLEFVSLRENTIHQHATGLANTKTQFKPSKVPLEHRALIAKRVFGGERPYAIAKEYECSEALIYWIVRQQG
jgi:hypothetical protein|tara:strand:+ start:151 stop:651 length:501 start_codon:yes stop_codon:yes gene_type:complete